MIRNTILSFALWGALSSAAPNVEKRQDATASAQPSNIQTFDYVIVGGGTAGLVMANRLSASGAYQVAIVEAGGFYEVENPTLSQVPGLDALGVGASPQDTNVIDWNFTTTAQTGLDNRSIHYARGKCLGGSSARNFMIYQRGTKQSYDNWVTATGDSSYSFANLLPYFEKSVQFTPPNTADRFPNATAEYNAGVFSASGGPLHVSYPNYAQPWSTWVQPALNQIGVPTVTDFNSGSLLGTQYAATTINPAFESRDSSESSFLQAALTRTNLHLFNGTMAKKILFSGTTATGVTVTSGGTTFQLNAKKEVVVSAGVFQSPQLLMVSGIGPAATLQKYRIPCVKELPGVGQGMQDHVFFGPTYRVNVPTASRLSNLTYVGVELATEYQLGQGPLTNNDADFLGWEKIPQSLRSGFSSATQKALAAFPADWPEIEYLSSPALAGNFSSISGDQPQDGFQYATILTALVAPLSRGSVSISSTDTSVPPVINPGFLTSSVDQEVAVAAYKRARAVFGASSMKPVLIGPEYYPGSAVQTDAQILATIKHDAMTVWHASCTCAMGTSKNPNAVLDSHARVYGVKNLRVVDASSFPLLPPGHPQSTIYALAEKISDLMLNGQ